MSDTALILKRLESIEQVLTDLLSQKAKKEMYSTCEVAKIIGRSEYTVREYCRKGQVQAEKAPNGRGWLVPNSEVDRLRNFGPTPE